MAKSGLREECNTFTRSKEGLYKEDAKENAYEDENCRKETGNVTTSKFWICDITGKNVQREQEGKSIVHVHLPKNLIQEKTWDA